MTVRREVHYRGNVQGVGFRYTVCRLAEKWNLASTGQTTAQLSRPQIGGGKIGGTVENLPDGRVRLVAEGDTTDIEDFLAEVADQMAGHIQETVSSSNKPTGEFGRFQIR